MKISLTVSEMFSLSKIIEFQNIIGYRAALTKLYHQMLDNETFTKIIDLYEQLRINAEKVQNDKNEERNSLIKELQLQKNSPSDELKAKLDKFNNELNQEIFVLNQPIINELNSALNENKEEFSYEFNNLTIKAIKNIVESEKTLQDLKLEPGIVNALMNLYIKLD